MRDAVKYRMGGKDYDLLPTFGVVDAFEDRHYSLFEHLERLSQGSATLHARAFLILQGLKAASPDTKWDFGTLMERMFDQGYWHEDVVLQEIEFIEKLIYTPEQYVAKKEQRANEQKGLQEIMGDISNSYSESQS